MTDTTASGKPGANALPARAERLVQRIEREALSIEQRAVAAVEAWYAAHFHKHAAAGTPSITSDDKAALIQHVTDAVATSKE